MYHVYLCTSRNRRRAGLVRIESTKLGQIGLVHTAARVAKRIGGARTERRRIVFHTVRSDGAATTKST